MSRFIYDGAVLFVAASLTFGCSSKSAAAPLALAGEGQDIEKQAAELPNDRGAAPASSVPAPATEPLTAAESQTALTGLWKIEPESILETDARFAQVPEEYRAEAVQETRNAVRGARFEFTEDGAMNLYSGSTIKEGRYEIESATAGMLILSTIPDLSTPSFTQSLSVEVSANRLSVTDLAAATATHMLVRADLEDKAPPVTIDAESKATSQ